MNMFTPNGIAFENYFICYYYTSNKNFYVKINAEVIKKIMLFFKLHTNLLYAQLIDLSFIDYYARKFRFDLFYNLLSLKYNSRLILSASVIEDATIPSITEIYPNANWYEREAWDMFGVYFTMHPDLRRILTDYGFKGHPLRKDFPMTGFIEVRYDAFLKRIMYEELSLSQEYRIFNLDNSWSTKAVRVSAN